MRTQKANGGTISGERGSGGKEPADPAPASGRSPKRLTPAGPSKRGTSDTSGQNRRGTPKARRRTDSELTEFGWRLRRYRERSGTSQAKLADAIGKSSGYIGLIETGVRGDKVDPDAVLMIAELFGLSPAETQDFFRAAGHPYLAARWGPASAITPVPQAIKCDRILNQPQKELLAGIYYQFIGRQGPSSSASGPNWPVPPSSTASGAQWGPGSFSLLVHWSTAAPATQLPPVTPQPPASQDPAEEARADEGSAVAPSAVSTPPASLDRDRVRELVDASEGRMTPVRAAAILEISGLTGAREIVDALVDDVFSRSLENGRDVLLQNMGILEVRQRNAVTRTNPRTGEKLRVPAKATVGFRPAVRLKERVTAASRTPREPERPESSRASTHRGRRRGVEDT